MKILKSVDVRVFYIEWRTICMLPMQASCVIKSSLCNVLISTAVAIDCVV